MPIREQTATGQLRCIRVRLHQDPQGPTGVLQLGKDLRREPAESRGNLNNHTGECQMMIPVNIVQHMLLSDFGAKAARWQHPLVTSTDRERERI